MGTSRAIEEAASGMLNAVQKQAQSKKTQNDYDDGGPI
jgi:hypothetical protein